MTLQNIEVKKKPEKRKIIIPIKKNNNIVI